VKEVRESVWFIEAENKGRYPYANSLYIEGEENLLIDTGAGPVLEELAGRTRRVVLSHYHRDHLTSNKLFKGASFSIHKADATAVESLEGFYRLSGLSQVEIEAFLEIVKQVDFSPTRIDCYFEDGDYFDLGRLKMKVIHLPGHTPGHCGFLIEKYNLVYAADVDLTRFGPWYGNPSSDLDQFRSSIRRLRDLKPELLITGHSLPVTKNIDQKLAAYEAVLDRHDDAIVKALKKEPATLKQLTDKKIIYRRHHGQEVLRFFEQTMIQKHLESLFNREIIAKTKDGLYEAL